VDVEYAQWWKKTTMKSTSSDDRSSPSFLSSHFVCLPSV
jgi:hypothetical protein